ncbi:FAD-dependent oxidoreductase [Paenibacillus cremeus]|uniref:Glutamate synthase subunit beta n=1 Tax=Paenibacillus cremeus TaxID=2163881 RepID=A0A559JVT2_9BACL|nr:NAD(P)-binding protein [Paenibacillus cremeus]TVY03996.1 glutamate synthase subunit beta [Paenibacillus cremeus]
MNQQIGSHAIVIGSGIAGLCTAQVLCRYFKEVTILERGAEPPHASEPRKEVPQGYHLHALLKAGEQALEQLFPGITHAMVQDGSIRINGTKELKWFHHGEWKKRFEGDISVLLQSRPFLEGHIRLQVEKNSNVRILYTMKAVQPIHDASLNKIIGIQVLDGASPQSNDLYSDLVIDASGFGSIFHQWFTRNGYKCPEEKVNIDLCYASQIYQLDDTKRRNWSTLLVYPSAPMEKVGGSISRIEGNRHIVTLMSYDSDLSHSVQQNFINITKHLSQEDVYINLQGAKALSEIKVYKVPYIVRHRYEKVKNLPQGFLFIGDALCRFDPVFGQGMSAAALEVLELEDCLKQEWKETRGISTHLTKHFYKKVSKVIDPVWKMILIEDFRYGHVTGKKPIGLSFLQWYTKRIFQRSSQNTDIYNAFIYVMNLLRPASTLFSPSILYKTFRRM